MATSKSVTSIQLRQIYTSIFSKRYPMELHMVHRNIHDEEVSEALEHENGLTVLGFKFQVIKNI